MKDRIISFCRQHILLLCSLFVMTLGVALCVWDRGHGTNDYELLDRNIKNGHEPTLEWFYPQVIRAIIDNGK